MISLLQRNLHKTTAIRRINGLNIENRLQMSQKNSTSTYYNSTMPINGDSETTSQLAGQENQQLEQLLHHSNLHQSNMTPRIPQSYELHSRAHQLVIFLKLCNKRIYRRLRLKTCQVLEN